MAFELPMLVFFTVHAESRCKFKSSFHSAQLNLFFVQLNKMSCSRRKVYLLWLVFIIPVVRSQSGESQLVKRQNLPDPNVNVNPGGGINRGGTTPFSIPST